MQERRGVDSRCWKVFNFIRKRFVAKADVPAASLSIARYADRYRGFDLRPVCVVSVLQHSTRNIVKSCSVGENGVGRSLAFGSARRRLFFLLCCKFKIISSKLLTLNKKHIF